MANEAAESCVSGAIVIRYRLLDEYGRIVGIEDDKGEFYSCYMLYMSGEIGIPPFDNARVGAADGDFFVNQIEGKAEITDKYTRPANKAAEKAENDTQTKDTVTENIAANDTYETELSADTSEPNAENADAELKLAERGQAELNELHKAKLALLERYGNDFKDKCVRLMRGIAENKTVQVEYDCHTGKTPLFTLFDIFEVDVSNYTKDYISRHIGEFEVKNNSDYDPDGKGGYVASWQYLYAGNKRVGKSDKWKKAVAALYDTLKEQMTSEETAESAAQKVQSEAQTVAREENAETSHPVNALTQGNYTKFYKLFASVVDGGTEEHIKMTAGKAFDPLSVERLSKHTVSIMHWRTQNGDLMREPDMTLWVDTENKAINALEYEQSSLGKYERVQNEDGEFDRVLQKRLNEFLKKWLTNIENQGYHIENGENPEDSGLGVAWDDEDWDNEDIEEQEAPQDVVQSVGETVDFTPQNFRITNINLGAGGLKAKYQMNIAAIRVLKEIETANRNATPAEQETLSKYVGFGGISQVFDPRKDDWQKEYHELKNTLTPTEYTAARKSTMNAFYTSPTVINGIYNLLNGWDLSPKKILEPSCGIGNFFGLLPESLLKAELYGVELDSLTGRIAQKLYPLANIQICGFEKTEFPNGFFDLCVGNVPFGDYAVADTEYKQYKLRTIHDYFFIKAIDKAAAGAVLAFVTSKGTLDKRDAKVREIIAKKAEFLGAVRLPNIAFKANANTEVTSDIIFLQKRADEIDVTPDWCYISNNDDDVPLNQYFIENPEQLLGNMVFCSNQYGSQSETACIAPENADLSTLLTQAIQNIKKPAERGTDDSGALQEDGGKIPAPSNVRNYTYHFVGDKPYYRQGAFLVPMSHITGKKLERLQGMDGIRLAMRELLTIQANPDISDEEVKAERDKLNKLYDNFVKKNGYLSDSANKQVFAADDDCNLLLSLEEQDEDSKKIYKTAIFEKRTVCARKRVERTDTAEDALTVTLDQIGSIDIAHMSNLCGRPPEEVITELSEKNIIYRNPYKIDNDDPLSGYEDASEYLSGNVRAKLKTLESLKEQGYFENHPELEKNLEALRNVQPPDVEIDDITLRIGEHWIELEDYRQFFYDYTQLWLIDGRLQRLHGGEYDIDYPSRDKSTAAIHIYGTERMNAIQIFENLLNHRDVVVKDPVITEDSNGKEKTRYVINVDETNMAQEKARQMQEAFVDWLKNDPALAAKYQNVYNDLFNGTVGREYDGSHLTFDGMTPFIELEAHQKNAVARAIYGGNSLFAHCVGAGKTFEMITAVMEKKRLGLIHKACVVVPKALTAQTAIDWLRLYPNAHILTTEPTDFQKNNRRRFAARVATGDYDVIVMSYEQFSKLPMSSEYREDFIQEEIRQLDYALDDLGYNPDKKGKQNQSVKALERAKTQLEAKFKKLLEGQDKDEGLNFEEMGIDCLVVDEAHNYKNGLVVTKMSNVSGVTTRPSNKAEDMLMKCRYLNNKYGEKNILFSTGTPVSNSMTELYTMQNYLARRKCLW